MSFEWDPVVARQRAATLIELLVALTISAVLAAAVLPLTSWGLEQTHAAAIKADSNLFVTIAKIVRHRAITERREFTLAFQSGSCSVTPTQPGFVGTCRHLKVARGGIITFNRTGVVTPGTFPFTSSVTELRCVVTLSLRGRIKRQCSGLKGSRAAR